VFPHCNDAVGRLLGGCPTRSRCRPRDDWEPDPSSARSRVAGKQAPRCRISCKAWGPRCSGLDMPATAKLHFSVPAALASKPALSTPMSAGTNSRNRWPTDSHGGAIFLSKSGEPGGQLLDRFLTTVRTWVCRCVYTNPIPGLPNSIFCSRYQENRPRYFCCKSFCCQSLPVMIPRHAGLPHRHLIA